MELPPISPTRFQEFLNIDKPVKSMAYSHIPFINIILFIVILCLIYLFVTKPNSLLGIQGQPGSAGPTGVTGPTGVRGITGVTGAGLTGISGITGITGFTGISGVKGITGSTGPPGSAHLNLSGNADLSSNTWSQLGNLWTTQFAATGIVGTESLIASWGTPPGALHQYPVGIIFPPPYTTNTLQVAVYIANSSGGTPTPNGLAGGINWLIL